MAIKTFFLQVKKPPPLLNGLAIDGGTFLQLPLPLFTGTGFVTVDLPAHGVGSAGRGHAGDMGPLRGCHHLRVLHTVDEGVAGVADRAAADRVVVHDLEYSYSYS